MPSWLSEPLRAALSQTLEAGEQSLLFLNRRGYAPLTLCRTCGHRMECPSCTSWLVEHRLAGRLQCHHCGYSARIPETCPECGAEDHLVACGPGVERLAEEVYHLYPDARVQVMSSDNIHGPSAAEELIRAISDHEVELPTTATAGAAGGARGTGRAVGKGATANIPARPSGHARTCRQRP